MSRPPKPTLRALVVPAAQAPPPPPRPRAGARASERPALRVFGPMLHTPHDPRHIPQWAWANLPLWSAAWVGAYRVAHALDDDEEPLLMLLTTTSEYAVFTATPRRNTWALSVLTPALQRVHTELLALLPESV